MGRHYYHEDSGKMCLKHSANGSGFKWALNYVRCLMGSNKHVYDELVIRKIYQVLKWLTNHTSPKPQSWKKVSELIFQNNSLSLSGVAPRKLESAEWVGGMWDLIN